MENKIYTTQINEANALHTMLFGHFETLDVVLNKLQDEFKLCYDDIPDNNYIEHELSNMSEMNNTTEVINISVMPNIATNIMIFYNLHNSLPNESGIININEVSTIHNINNNIDDDIDNDIKNNNLCPICMENIRTEMRKTLCGHIYCNECISMWLKKSKKCPCCMSDLDVLSTNKIKN